MKFIYLLKNLRPGMKFFSIPISIMIVILVITIYNLEDRDVFKELRILKAIEQKSLDLRFQMRGKRDPGNEIVIVRIDEKSIDKIGRYPWPRIYVAQFVDKMASYGTRVLALDVMYTEPQNIEILNTLDSLTREYEDTSVSPHLSKTTDAKEFMSSLQKERERYDEDAMLRNALERAVVEKGMDIISAIRFVDERESLHTDFTGKELSDTSRELLMESAYFPVLVSDVKLGKKDTNEDKLTVLSAESRKNIMETLLSTYPPKKAVGVINLIDPLAEWVTYQGFADTNTDYSAIVRTEYMAIQFNNEFYPPLGVQAARVYKGLEYGELKLWLTRELQFRETRVPIDNKNRMIINYCGPGNTFRNYSFCDVLDGKVTADAFKNKIVFLGATALDLGDNIATPFSSQSPGVEKHATVAENILHENFVVRDQGEINHDIVAIFFIGIAMGTFLPLLPSIWGGVAGVMVLFGYNIYAYMKFLNEGAWLNVTYPSITVITCFSIIIMYRFISEEKRRKEVKSAFENFMDPKVVHEILKEPENIKLGGEEKEITVYFSDIEKFSTISEKLSPTDLIELLNEYLSEMTDIILDYGGLLDKYIGDAIVAAFGAPLSQPDHAVKACLASIENQKKLSELNKKFVEEGKLQIKARIGLNTGRALVGNVGSTNRLSYTIIGDEVNLGARLEAANKYYGTYTMISEITYELARDHIEARELDKIRVVGKVNPVKVYELIDIKGGLQGSKLEVLGLYEKGLSEYKNREWQKAIASFQEALRKDPRDGPSLTYLERCKLYAQKGPREDWDGVYVLEAK